MNEFIEKLIGRLEELYARNDKTKKMSYEEQDWEKFDLFTHRCEGIYSAISIVNQLAEEYNNGWRDVDVELPVDDHYILLSFSNFSVPLVGRYEEDDEGGAFYIGDESETCVQQGLFVNAWQPLPKAYRLE